MPSPLGRSIFRAVSARRALGCPAIPRAALVCLAYFVLHLATHFGARFFEVGPGVSLWYPPAGLAMALLVLFGPRFAPVVFAANLAGACATTDYAIGWPAFVFPLFITGNYTAAAILARRFILPHQIPGSPRRTVGLIASALLAPVGVAMAGTVVAARISPIPFPPDRLLQSALDWWLGDASGVLTVMPVVLVFVGPWLRGEHRPLGLAVRAPHRFLLVAVQALALVGSLWLVFAVDSVPRAQMFYLCLLPLVWICLQHGLPGATLASLAITMGGLLGLRLTQGADQSTTSFLFLELTAAVVGLGLGSTVTSRNAAEKGLAANEARLDRVIAGAQVGLWDWNLQTGQIACNERCNEMLGLPPHGPAATAELWQQHIHPEDRQRVAVTLQRHLAGSSALFETEYRLSPLEGSERWVHARGSVVARDAAGRPLLLSGTKIDITDRKRAEIEADRLLQIVEAATDFVLTTAPDGRILYANAAFLRFWGADLPASGLCGQSLRDLLSGCSRAAVSSVIDALPAAGVWSGEIALANAAGDEVPVSLVAQLHRTADGAPDSFSFVMRDISRQKQAEAARLEQERRLLQLQKTESLGVLAGGIAHDFNNLLTAMLGNAGLARLDLPSASPLHEPLTQIETAAHRAADLCQQMLAYAGHRPLADSDVDLNALIGQTQRLFQVSIGKKITVHLDLAPAPVVVRAAPPQLQQVVLNLVINAAEAIGDRDGRIDLRTVGREFSADQLRAEFGAESLRPGPYVLCEVEDSGCGIPPEIRRRIFEPFFTTKTAGHGLGLAAVHGVVTSHRGAIAVTSEPGHGTTFRFVLPLTGTAPTAPAAASPAARWRGEGLVLVVDDEPSVQQVAVHLLEGMGFSTVTAADGVEAVALFRRHSDRLRLVLLDLIMPRKDGVETLGELHRLNPAVPVILMSGFTGNLGLDRFAQVKPAALLAKPFALETLQARLREILGRN
jgi:PAS domain S-box-containing protein